MSEANTTTETAAPAPLTPEPTEALQQQAAKALEHWNNYVRATADLDNYKKRAARERSDAIAYANQSLLQKLLPVLDNFEMAQAAATTAADASAQSLQSGVAMILTQLKSTLADAGLEEIESQGKPFDPNFHEAVSEQESSAVPDHHVLQQLRRGYKLRDRLLRPATVIVAKAPATK
jgi:molecular chaperone GrpE